MTFKKTFKPAVTEYSELRCDWCDRHLHQIGQAFGTLPGILDTSVLQPQDALILTLHGGYSMAIDPTYDKEDDDALTLLICTDCIKTIPPLAKRVALINNE
jgi:hypothetical protein